MLYLVEINEFSFDLGPIVNLSIYNETKVITPFMLCNPLIRREDAAQGQKRRVGAPLRGRRYNCLYLHKIDGVQNVNMNFEGWKERAA